ncbi:MAG: hypothetical protein LBR21_06065 [Propionibacteriaceae bacterium]|jgi:hypothetical protein|nr:hypothetical protein [Propionibacteriaceae bacterium]
MSKALNVQAIGAMAKQIKHDMPEAEHIQYRDLADGNIAPDAVFAKNNDYIGALEENQFPDAIIPPGTDVTTTALKDALTDDELEVGMWDFDITKLMALA